MIKKVHIPVLITLLIGLGLIALLILSIFEFRTPVLAKLSYPPPQYIDIEKLLKRNASDADKMFNDEEYEAAKKMYLTIIQMIEYRLGSELRDYDKAEEYRYLYNKAILKSGACQIIQLIRKKSSRD